MTTIERCGWFFVFLLAGVASGCGLFTSTAAKAGVPGASSPAVQEAARQVDEAGFNWLHLLLTGLGSAGLGAASLKAAQVAGARADANTRRIADQAVADAAKAAAEQPAT